MIGIILGNMGIMEKKMETTIFSVKTAGFLDVIPFEAEFLGRPVLSGQEEFHVVAGVILLSIASLMLGIVEFCSTFATLEQLPCERETWSAQGGHLHSEGSCLQAQFPSRTHQTVC